MRFTINHRTIEVTREEVVRCVAGVQAEQPLKYVALIGDERFPPKQVLRLLTGWDRQSYTTEDAQRVLRRLGFEVAGAAEPPGGVPVDRADSDLARRIAAVEAANTTLNLAIEALAARIDALQPA